MFASLFAEGGLSLDRLKALLEVSAAGSIVKAANGEPVRQSQYSRQIKELEDFFRIKLIERHGKGIRLTARGLELARISRFFLLGLANFQRGCLAEEQTFRIGAGNTVIRQFILPVLGAVCAGKPSPRFAVEPAGDDEIERRLHDLTLDFGVVTKSVLSRPLQLKTIGEWRLFLWTSAALCRDPRRLRTALRTKQLPLIVPAAELPRLELLADYRPRLICNSFLEAKALLLQSSFATLLPHFLKPDQETAAYARIPVRGVTTKRFQYYFAWNPRLLRLNPHAIGVRNSLVGLLTEQMQDEIGQARRGAESKCAAKS